MFSNHEYQDVQQPNNIRFAGKDALFELPESEATHGGIRSREQSAIRHGETDFCAVTHARQVEHLHERRSLLGDVVSYC
jgi:hypothetical protein